MTEKHNKGFGSADVRYTASKYGKALYAILLGWPQGRSHILGALRQGEEVTGVTLLGSDTALKWEAHNGGLEVSLPGTPPEGVRDAWVLKLALAGTAASPEFGAKSTKTCLR